MEGHTDEAISSVSSSSATGFASDQPQYLEGLDSRLDQTAGSDSATGSGSTSELSSTPSSNSTHPSSFSQFSAHLDSLSTFQSDLRTALSSSLSEPPKYSGVYVLLLQWEAVEKNLCVEDEIERLEQVFRGRFFFSTEKFKIPNKDAQWELIDRLNQFRKRHAEERNLFIICYNGHGSFDKEDSCWLLPTLKHRINDGISIRWNPIQSTLEALPQDTLFILDCCYSGAAAIHKGSGPTKELLAACGRETPTFAGPDSFSNSLIRALWRTQGPTVPISRLYSEIICSKEKLSRAPIHVFLNDNIKSIVLPLGFALSDPPKPSSFSPTFYQVLLSIKLTEDLKPNLETWKRWLRDSPPEMVALLDVQFQSLNMSGSTLAMVTMPVEIWALLPERPAYRFIDFVKSGNLLLDESRHSSSHQISTPTSLAASQHLSVIPLFEALQCLCSDIAVALFEAVHYLYVHVLVAIFESSLVQAALGTYLRMFMAVSSASTRLVPVVFQRLLSTEQLVLLWLFSALVISGSLIVILVSSTTVIYGLSSLISCLVTFLVSFLLLLFYIVRLVQIDDSRKPAEGRRESDQRVPGEEAATGQAIRRARRAWRAQDSIETTIWRQ